MAGMVTWKRNTPMPITRYKKYISGTWSTGDINITGNPGMFQSDQSTTSFRTGRWGPSENDEMIPTSFQQAFRGWFLENRDLSNPSDAGHPFSSLRRDILFSHERYHIENAGRTKRYSFPLYVDWSKGTGGVFGWWPTSVPNLNGYGTKAIANTIPTNPTSDLATALVEFVYEGFPRLFGESLLRLKTIIFKDLGDEYLNVEFGWKPFVADLRNLLTSVLNADKLVRQLARDSGRIVRRRWEFPEERSVIRDATASGAIGSPDNSSNFDSLHPFGLGGTLHDVVTLDHKVWFSGAYSYYLHDPDGLTGKMERYAQQAKYLLGIRIDPEVLWNVAPWSWLSDWVFNIGDVLHNACALSSDSLVIRWAYVMSTQVTTRTLTVTGARHSMGTYPPVTTTFVETRKQRVQSTAYGFGKNPGSFSARQNAILASLAATRVASKRR
jgi:hypothetical protein